MALKLYNTLGKKKQTFKPIVKGKAGMYTCGPTVYWYAHVGNLRTYIFEDVLKRILLYNGFKVRHVMNLTDVGHLTSDADTGEDKLEKAAKQERKSVWNLAEFYAAAFFKDCEKLNIIKPDIVCKATNHIKEQIALIKRLEEQGYAYVIEDGVYFDTSKLKDYGKLTGMSFDELKNNLKAGARVELVEGKRNITDFALWKFSPKGQKRQMEWASLWGVGFPGWHIECSAMSMKYLGESFDIHCGGVDHIPIHHTNEIAQSEAATGKKFVNYWLHGAFLVLPEARMGKSEGNIILVDNFVEEGFNPLAYRYLVLTAHYRSQLAFSKDSLKSAQIAFDRLCDFVLKLKSVREKIMNKTVPKIISGFKRDFKNAVNDDLNMPQALVAVNGFIGAVHKQIDAGKIGEAQARKILRTMFEFDEVLGLKLNEVKEEKLPSELMKLVGQREEARKKKDFKTADKIRQELKSKGVLLEDTLEGARWKLAK